MNDVINLNSNCFWLIENSSNTEEGGTCENKV
jgi:hypothetical protein